MFADKYLKKNNDVTQINESPLEKTGIRVVIPCFREPDICETLESLKLCDLPEFPVEVIILINHSEAEVEEIKQINQRTKVEIDNWIVANQKAGVVFYAVGPVELKKKWAGAGLARKKGMDEAVRRFNSVDKPDGIIVSLDADTIVEKNYLTEIAKYFKENPRNVGATIAFEHQKSDLLEKQLEGILLYEKYLDYYKRALTFTGYPYSLFTIGSAFAVTAAAYVKRGGMNRRQAGEDFYFLQNLVQQGIVGEITSTKVFPSARLSDRVPFGTGPVLQKWMNEEEDLSLTYNFGSFQELKKLFILKDQFYKCSEIEYEKLLEELPASVSEFVCVDGFKNELEDLNKNCSTLEVYQKRFFHKFNAFKILKYLNYAHEKHFEKADLMEQISLLDQED